MTPAWLRPSTEVRVVSAGNQIGRLVAGMLVFATSSYFELLEYREPPTHTSHIIIFASGMLLGILVAFGVYVFPVIQQVFVFAQQTDLPWIGGRRRGDPPKDIEIPPHTDGKP